MTELTGTVLQLPIVKNQNLSQKRAILVSCKKIPHNCL
jgi:hypothetical protein